MANDFEVGVDVAVPPAAAWELAGDPARIGEWFTPVADLTMDGDVRRVTMRHGARLVERITERDAAARSYSYTVEEGIPGLASHHATIRVEDAPGGCRVVWRQHAAHQDPAYDIEARLSGVMAKGLASLKDRLEGATPA
ncbi:MAG: SRPBCC family protein [Thermoleophilia bacterium]|nr:SRPBCC family protein [Thermoleophilia bacterium]